MSTETTHTIDILPEDTKVTITPNNDLVATPSICIENLNPSGEISGTSKEYSIVGDSFYAGIENQEAPKWLTDLIDSVVSSSINEGFTDYDLLVQDVRNAIDALDIAKNTYVEQVDFEYLVDQIIGVRLQTLNASIENTYATIVDLDTVVANTDFALTQRVNDLNSEFNNEINSRITNVQQAFASADAAIANDITALTNTFIDQESRVSGTAEAVSGLQTYIGLSDFNEPDGTGLLSRIDTVENQVDGKIEYFFYESYLDISGAGSEQQALDIIDNSWNTTELKEINHGNVVYFRDSENGYWYQGKNNEWLVITDTTLYTAVQNAANAQASADGKVSQFYAWYDPENKTPSNFVIRSPKDNSIIETIIASNFKYWFKTDGVLYYYTNNNWIPYPSVSEGDVLTAFDISTRDNTAYTYNGVSWVQSGPKGIVSKSRFFVDLENNVTGPTGHVATSISELEIESKAYADAEGARVENKFEYDSEIILNGKHYKSGFGLNSSGVTQPAGANGSQGNAYDSEFWVNAERFVLKSPSYPDVSAVFKVSNTGIQLGVEHTEATRNEPRGNYSSTTNYKIGDIVLYNNSSYIAIQDSFNRTPSGSSSFWQLLAKEGTSGGFTDFLFIRSTGTPSDPPGNTGWKTNVNDVPAGAGKLWSIKKVVSQGNESVTYTDKRVIEAPIIRELVIYSDSTTGSISKPTGSRYDFSRDTLSINNSNWNNFVPSLLNNNHKIYVCTALVVGNITETSILVNWSNPNIYAFRQDGRDADALTVTPSYNPSTGVTTLFFSDGTTAAVSDGKDGTPSGVKVIYANNASGSGATFTYNNQPYVNYYEWIGTPPSSPPSGLTYTKFVGEDGDSEGVIPIYANSSSGSGATFNYSNQKYVNFYEWKGTAPTSIPSGLTYVKFVGDDGQSVKGDPGARGTAVLTYSANLGTISPGSVSSGSIASYWNISASAAYDQEITGDTLIVTNTNTSGGWTHIYEYNGSSWVSSNTFTVNGNQVVEGTLSANAIGSGSFITTSLDTAAVPNGFSGTTIDFNGVRVYNNGVLRVKLGKL